MAVVPVHTPVIGLTIVSAYARSSRSFGRVLELRNGLLLLKLELEVRKEEAGVLASLFEPQLAWHRGWHSGTLVRKLQKPNFLRARKTEVSGATLTRRLA